MNDQARQALLDLRGKELTRPALEGTLLRRCPTERAALLAAWDHGVFRELGAVAGGDPRLLPTRLAERLQQDAGLTIEAAWWAVGTIVRFYGCRLGAPGRPVHGAQSAGTVGTGADPGNASARRVPPPATTGEEPGGAGAALGWVLGGLVGAFVGTICGRQIGTSIRELAALCTGDFTQAVESVRVASGFCGTGLGLAFGAIVGARWGRIIGRSITAVIVDRVQGAGAGIGHLLGGLVGAFVGMLFSGLIGACVGVLAAIDYDEHSQAAENICIAFGVCGAGLGLALGAITGSRLGRVMGASMAAAMNRAYGATAVGWGLGLLCASIGGIVGGIAGWVVGSYGGMLVAGWLGVLVGPFLGVPIGVVVGVYFAVRVVAFLGGDLK